MNLEQKLASLKADVEKRAAHANNLATTLVQLDKNHREASKEKAKADEDIRRLRKDIKRIEKLLQDEL